MYVSLSVTYMKVPINFNNNLINLWERFSNLRSIIIYMTGPITPEYLVGLTKLQYLEKIYLYVSEMSQEALNVCEKLPITILSFRNMKKPLPDLESFKRWEKLQILYIYNDNITADKPLLDCKLYCNIKRSRDTVLTILKVLLMKFMQNLETV